MRVGELGNPRRPFVYGAPRPDVALRPLGAKKMLGGGGMVQELTFSASRVRSPPSSLSEKRTRIFEFGGIYRFSPANAEIGSPFLPLLAFVDLLPRVQDPRHAIRHR